MTDTKPYLQIKGLAKKYGDNLAVKPLELDIYQHEIFALLGSSGSGKSTLLRMLAGMEKPTDGQIILDGQDITHLAPYDRPINMMFQSYALFPHMTVADNIAFGLKQDKLPKDEIADRVDEMLRLVQMPQYAKRKPHQLSGGQQQRVALARSLAKRPKLLLLDEPLGALDKKLRQQTQFELVNTLEKVGVTCIMVTHDQEEAMTMANRVAIMSNGQLQQVGTPADVYDYPKSKFVAEFIGETNIFEGKLVHKDEVHALIDCPELPSKIYTDQSFVAEDGQTMWISIRPEDIDLHKEKPAHRDTHNWAKGKVKEIAARVDEMLRLVQMPQYAKRKPHQLSGGQQQRVALARSLAKRPKLLLLDEPLGALDKKLRQQTQFELVNTLEKVGVTCIMVTHDQEEAMTMANRVAIMSNGQLQQVGTPADVYDYPESKFVAEFIGETNIFEGTLVHKDEAHALIDCPELPSKIYTDQSFVAEDGQTMWISIRPEDIDLHKEKPAHRDTHNWAKGKVKEIAYLGSFAIYHVQMDNGRIIKSQVPAPYWYVRGIEPPTWGDEVYLDWPENQPTPLTR